MKSILGIFLSMVWISIMEFSRNETFLKHYWTNHYGDMGLTFPSEPINGAIWGIWALCFSIGLFYLSKKFNFLETCLLGWLFGFVLMWLVTGNMGVLPYELLLFAVPLSMIEVIGAVWIIRKLNPKT